MIFERIRLGQRTCSYSEICIAASFGGLPFEHAEKSLRLFAQEVLPAVQAMDAPLHADCNGEDEQVPA